MIEFTPTKILPEKPGHYLVISDMNWYHGGCFDTDDDGTSLSYAIAYFDIVGWNKPYIVAWAELPPFPPVYVELNKKLLAEREKSLKPHYGTRCEIG